MLFRSIRMYCPNCGAELKDDATFCGNCGKKIDAKIKANMNNTKQFQSQSTEEGIESKTEQTSQTANSEQQTQRVDTDSKEYIARDQLKPFDKIAIKFTSLIANPFIGIVYLYFCGRLFSEGGVSGILFGLFMLVLGIAYLVEAVKAWIDIFRRKSDIDSTMTKESLRSCRRTLIIGVIVIVFGAFVIQGTGGGIYTNVQSVVFDNIGDESIGTIVDDNIPNAKWSKKKISSGVYVVSVTGYNKNYGDIKIDFYYEKEKDGSVNVTLQRIHLLDDNKTYDGLQMGVIWSSFYSDDSIN